MVFSMCGLMMRLKWCAWTAVFCSSISFANSRVSDDTKQVVILFFFALTIIICKIKFTASYMVSFKFYFNNFVAL